MSNPLPIRMAVCPLPRLRPSADEVPDPETGLTPSQAEALHRVYTLIMHHARSRQALASLNASPHEPPAEPPVALQGEPQPTPPDLTPLAIALPQPTPCQRARGQAKRQPKRYVMPEPQP